MTETPFQDIRHRAEQIARLAGEAILPGWGACAKTETKRSPSDIVTEYDLRSESLIRAELAASFPNHAVVGEEEGGEANDGLVWYVDPIDGTSNFAHGHPFFCISMGLWKGGDPLAGVVFAPAMNLLFSAVRGGGVSCNGRTVQVSSTATLSASLLSTGFPPDRATRSDNNYREFSVLDSQTHGVRRCAAAALELSLVATGGYDGFWDRGLAPWDLAAGALFVLEAGGQVSAPDGQPFALHDGAVLATNGVIHEELRSALAHASRLPPFTTVK